MGKLPEPQLGDKVVVDVQITDINAIPAKYFVHTEVQDALLRVIRSDVIVHQNPVPPGVRAVFGAHTMATARQRLAVANQDLAYQLKRAAPGLIFIALIIMLIASAVVWAWGQIHG